MNSFGLIDADTARALEEIAKATGKGIDALTEGGRYVGWILGNVPRDLVGLLIGDWLTHKRIRAWARLSEQTGKILRDRGVENREEVSPSVAIPLISAAIDEDREVLRDLWAKLLANALDPNRSNLVRPSLIELLRQLDPLDARILEQLVNRRDAIPSAPDDLANGLAHIFKVSRDETCLSLEHLHELGCLGASPNQIPRPPASAKGRILILAVSE